MSTALGGITSGIFGLMQTGLNNIMADSRAEEDRRENYEYNEMSAKNADRRTRALYSDFYSPSALMRQYQEAGLSPGLMFGGTPGQGGMSGAQGNGANGPQTPFMPYSIVEAAQAAALFAQANKTNKEAKQVDPLANATVSSLLADAGYKKAAEAAAAAQATGTKLDNYLKENTMDASIYMICEMSEQAGHEAEKAYYEMKDAQLMNQFNVDTFEDRKKIVHKQMELLAANISESKATAALNDQQKKYLKDQILQNISTTMLEWSKYDLSTEQFEAFLSKQIPIMEKELDTKLEQLGIERRKLVINAITDTFKSLAMGAMAASSMGLGKGSNQSPRAEEVLGKPVQHSKKTNNIPAYKTNTVWDY